MAIPAAVLLDFDGTMVNSETLGREVELTLLRSYGIVIEPDEFSRRYQNMSLVAFGEELSQLTGETRDWVVELNAAYESLMRHQLRPHDDVMAIVDALDQRRCIVTNSPRDFLLRKMAWADLPLEWAARAVTSDEVSKVKPDPEPYLRALDIMGVTANDALAVEDTTHGILSALAAGLTTYGFAGGIESAASLRESGVQVVEHWSAFRTIFW
jgi:HAD superfamily hydrolase (TIGR01509 family)